MGLAATWPPPAWRQAAPLSPMSAGPMSPLLPGPWDVLVWSLAHAGPPRVLTPARSSGSWAEWPESGPSLGGAAGGPFPTRLSVPTSLGPSPKRPCPLVEPPAGVLGRLVVPRFTPFLPGLREMALTGARVHRRWRSCPRPAPAPGLSAQDQGQEEG